MSILTASCYCLWKNLGGKKKFMSFRRKHFFHFQFFMDVLTSVDSRRIFKMQINEPLLLTAQQPGEGGGSDPHLPETQPRWLQADQEHELLQISAGRGGIPHRPRGAAIRGAYADPVAASQHYLALMLLFRLFSRVFFWRAWHFTTVETSATAPGTWRKPSRSILKHTTAVWQDVRGHTRS